MKNGGNICSGWERFQPAVIKGPNSALMNKVGFKDGL